MNLFLRSDLTVAATVLVLVSCSPALASISAPSPPQFTDSSTDWHYTAPNGTLLGHYRFDFWEATQRERHTNFNVPDTLIIGFKDFKAMEETVVVSDSNTGACCIAAPMKLQTTFAADLFLMIPTIPPNATYVGTRVIDQRLCHGWTFLWSDDGKQVNMWMGEAGISNEMTFYPALLELPHNGRYVKYPWFSVGEPAGAVWTLDTYKTTCQPETTCPDEMKSLIANEQASRGRPLLW